MSLEIEVIVWRGAIAESRHRIEATVAGPDGPPREGTADPQRIATFRSAAKPFQLLSLVERGHAERFGFRDEELAIMAASHTGTAYHLALVRGILARLGLTEADLACGTHEPFDPEAATEYRLHPVPRSPLYNNCSGKHAGMLALALAEGWPTAGYERADHPVQQLMKSTIAEVCGVTPGDLGVAVDGCNVSVFALPLAAMARGYARLAGATASGDARERALARIRSSMMAWPRAVSGEGRLNTLLMEWLPGRVVSKGGAEGLECVGWAERGLGVAIKCEDGSARGVEPALLAWLEQMGVFDGTGLGPLEARRHPVVRNPAGTEVGRVDVQIRERRYA
jgi:L-asparaginase II